MLFPVRCFSCGKVLANKYEKYKKYLSLGKSRKETLDYLEIKRYCCRQMFMCHIDCIDDFLKYKPNSETKVN